MGQCAMGTCAMEGPSMGHGAKCYDAMERVDVKGVTLGCDAVGHGAVVVL